MKKTLLIGNFGARNIGDELILSFAVEENKEVVVMTADPQFSQDFCGEQFETIPPFPAGFRSVMSWILKRKKYSHLKIDQVIFPGGGLFAIKSKADFIWWCQFQWAKKLFPKAAFIFKNQGVDSKTYFFHKLFTKSVFSRADEISVRDKKSADFLRSIGIGNVKVVGDRVEINLQSEKSEKREANTLLMNAKKSVSDHWWNQVQEKLPKNTEMMFVCFDSDDAQFVPKGFKGEIFYPHTRKETYELFKNASLAIGQRLHFLILAEHFCGNKKTFVLGEPYAEKVANFCEKKNLKQL